MLLNGYCALGLGHNLGLIEVPSRLGVGSTDVALAENALALALELVRCAHDASFAFAIRVEGRAAAAAAAAWKAAVDAKAFFFPSKENIRGIFARSPPSLYPDPNHFTKLTFEIRTQIRTHLYASYASKKAPFFSQKRRGWRRVGAFNYSHLVV